MRRWVAVVLAGLVATPLVLSWSAEAGGAGPRAQTVPPPTPVPPFGSPSPFPSTLDTPAPSSRPPPVEAGSIALFDLDSGDLLFRRRAEKRRPVASTTKIMTALLVLEATEPGDLVTVSAGAVAQEGSLLGLQPGERIPVRRLLMALLLQSANDAAVALAEHVAGTVEEFVGRMNGAARRLGARDTMFASPNGLDDAGYSTAADMALITAEAYDDPTFAKVVARDAARIPSPEGDPRFIQNRNALLWLYDGAIGVKTGYTAAAGFCLVGAADRDGLRLGTVVLGSPDEAFSDAAALLNYGFEAFERRAVVEEGDHFGPVEIDGVDVDLVADGGLEILVRSSADLDEIVLLRPGIALPLAEGATVGEVVIRAGERDLGAVPLVTVEEVRPPPEPPAPWWERTWTTVREFFVRIFDAVFG
jgi:serine-type D-Ala-D-Ala carboxypeptidase (penicillin-binding protein 5/6)